MIFGKEGFFGTARAHIPTEAQFNAALSEEEFSIIFRARGAVRAACGLAPEEDIPDSLQGRVSLVQTQLIDQMRDAFKEHPLAHQGRYASGAVIGGENVSVKQQREISITDSFLPKGVQGHS